jgi:hypothetical protein
LGLGAKFRDRSVFVSVKKHASYLGVGIIPAYVLTEKILEFF